jgi:hypothetical protein
MSVSKEGRIVLVRPWSTSWHSDDKGPSGRGICGWAHTEEFPPRARWTVVVERPNGVDQSAHAMCDDCLTRAIELYGTPERDLRP